MTFTLWITGLPGSGKSTIAKEVLKKCKNTEYLRLDEFRKEIIPQPKYTSKERELVYKKLVARAATLAKKKNVIIDATAHKRKWRNAARKKIKNFVEVYVQCSLKICIQRESKRKQSLVIADMYKKAVTRKRTGKQFPGLGKVIGVDIPYEESKRAEIIIHSEKITPKQAAKFIIDSLQLLKQQ